MHDGAVRRVGASYKCLPLAVVDSCSNDDKGRDSYGCSNGDDELCSLSLSFVRVDVNAMLNPIGCSNNGVGGNKVLTEVLRNPHVVTKDSEDISRDVDSESVDNDTRLCDGDGRTLEQDGK